MLSPTYTATVSANYLYPIGNGWAFAPYVAVNRRGPIWWDALNTLSTPPKDLLDLRLPFQSEHLYVTPYAKNLLNEQYPLGASVNGFGPGLNGRFLSEPRTFMAPDRARGAASGAACEVAPERTWAIARIVNKTAIRNVSVQAFC
jgi:outer membrane receptor protein involved in Fe transport